MNETITSCGRCPYCYNGKCFWDKRCSYVLTETINNQNNDVQIMPVEWQDPKIIILNSKGVKLCKAQKMTHT